MLVKLASSAWMVLEYAWYPVLVFAATPYFLHTLGTDRYGYWMLLTATVGFSAFLSTGTGAATIKQISAELGQASRVPVEHVIRSSLTIALVGGAFLAALVLGIFAFAGDILFAKMADHSLLRLTGTTAALLIWIEQIDNVFASTLKGAEHFGPAARVEMSSKAVQLLAAILVLAAGGGMAALYGSLVTVAIGRLIAKVWMVRRCMGVVSLQPSWSKTLILLQYAKWGWLQGAGGLLFGVADRLLVGSLLGPSSLTYYSVASQLAQPIHGVSAAASSVVFPNVSRRHQNDPAFSLRSVTTAPMAGNLLLSSTMLFALLIFGESVLSLWLGEEVADASAPVLRYLSIAYWLLAINVVPHFILLGLGRIRFVAMSNFAAGVVLVVLIYGLLPSQGLPVVGIARIAYGVIIFVNFVPLSGYLWREYRGP